MGGPEDRADPATEDRDPADPATEDPADPADPATEDPADPVTSVDLVIVVVRRLRGPAVP
jgi:hypothetical protein